MIVKNLGKYSSVKIFPFVGWNKIRILVLCSTMGCSESCLTLIVVVIIGMIDIHTIPNTGRRKSMLILFWRYMIFS